MRYLLNLLTIFISGLLLAQAPTIDWQRTFGGSDFESASQIQKTFDGGFIFIGTSGSNDGDVSNNYGASDYWIVKLSSIGNIEWEKNFGGSETDSAHSIQQTTDGGYIVIGYSLSNDGDISNPIGIVDY